jgi:hypothetical protein
MAFLRADRNPETSWFWEVLAREHSGASAALQELAPGDSSVVCDPAEAAAAVSWARRHSAWLDEPARVWVATWVSALPDLRATADVMADVFHAIASQPA